MLFNGRSYKQTMSQRSKYTIRCPKCGHEEEVELYESVNVKTSPELKQALFANQLNAVTCGACGASFRVDKPLLYHDPDHGYMVYLLPLSDRAAEAGEREFGNALQRLNGLLPKGVEAPRVCLVFSRTELVERIFLLEAGLNERIIEYIKYLIYTRNPGRLDPATKVLLFNAEDSTPENLCFVVQDTGTRKLEAVLHYPRETYKALSEMFDRDENTGTLMELFPGPHVSARTLLLRDPSAPTPPAPPTA